MITIIIPALNEEKNIGNCIKEIKKQAPDAEIIVVDGRSTDKTIEIAKKLGAIVIVEEKESVSAARNKGLRLAKGEIVCFVDADTIPNPNWFEKILEPFDNKKVVGVGGSAVPINGRTIEKFGLWLVFRVFAPMTFKFQIPLVTGQNMAFRTTEAKQVGGFPEVIKEGHKMAEGEDTIMFLRLRKKGKIVHSNSSVSVSMRRIRKWGLRRYLFFNIRNWIHTLKFGTPLAEDYEPME